MYEILVKRIKLLLEGRGGGEGYLCLSDAAAGRKIMLIADQIV